MRKGFTMVELVIVMAVIAILAAVLIPTFSSIIEKANLASAQSDAKNGLMQILTGSDAKIPDGDCVAVVVKNKGESSEKTFWFPYENGSLATGLTEKPSWFNVDDYNAYDNSDYSEIPSTTTIYVKK